MYLNIKDLVYLVIIFLLLLKIYKKPQLISIIIILIGSIIIESFFKFKKNNKQYIKGDHYIVTDEILGYRSKNNFKTVLTEIVNDQITYKDVVFNFDKKGRRIPERINSNENDTKAHAIFLGGSYTFGDGINYEQTLPHHFKVQSLFNYKIYNYALSGYGPTQNLLLLRQKGSLDDISPKKGICVYVMKTHHINRATGVPRYLSENHRIPIARLNDKNKIEFHRYYELPKLQIYHCKLYNIIKNSCYTFSHILQNNDSLMIDWKNAIDITVNIFNEIKTEYQKHFDGRFFLLIRETENMPIKWKERFEKKLFDYNIQFLFEPSIIPIKNKHIHSLNTHPSSDYNEWTALNMINSFDL